MGNLGLVSVTDVVDLMVGLSRLRRTWVPFGVVRFPNWVVLFSESFWVILLCSLFLCVWTIGRFLTSPCL